MSFWQFSKAPSSIAIYASDITKLPLLGTASQERKVGNGFASQVAEHQQFPQEEFETLDASINLCGQEAQCNVSQDGPPRS